MALVCDISLPSGINLKDAYFKIYSLSGNKDLVNLNIQIYVSKEKCDNQGIPVAGNSYSFTPDLSLTGKNFLEQGYDYLKSHPDFKNAIDA